MRPRLRFRPDGTFTIVQLTDLHLADLGPLDARTAALAGAILDRERPDLAVVTGDVISGADAPDPERAFRAALRPIDEREVPFAVVLGNHDDEGALSRRDLIAIARSFPRCLSEPGPASLPGAGHFALDVAASRGEGAALALVFLDSGGYDPADPKLYASIGAEQIAWFRAAAAARASAPALVFFHIPLPEFEDVWAAGGCRGERNEPVCCPPRNDGFFAAACAAGNVLGILVGHDHVNDYDGALGGVRLVYGRTTGHGGYGRDGFARGARVIRLREGERAFETWVRLEGGEPGEVA